MSIQYLFANNVTTTLASGITTSATSLTVTGGFGALFPQPTTGQAFIFTIVKATDSTVYEICTCTSRTTDTFNTITRATEGTTAKAWAAGDYVNIFPTAAGLANMAQTGAQQNQNSNYAADVGFANNYSVTLSPPLTAHVVGMPIRWKAAATNSAASVFYDGVGSAALVLPPAIPLTAGVIQAGGIYTCTWDGTRFQLQWSPNLAPYATLASPTFTGSPLGPTGAPGSSTALLATTAFVNPNSLLSTNGYRVQPDGSTFQWGQVTIPASGGASITFPRAFSSACYSVNLTPGSPTNGTPYLTALSRTAFSCDNSAGTSLLHYWQAVGA